MTRLSFYSPLKPIDSPIPSGDREISRGLFDFFETQGLKPYVVSRLVSRRSKNGQCPFRALGWPFQFSASLFSSLKKSPDLLFTYHNYYKAPDWIHPLVSWIKGTPYVVFEASFKPSLKQSDPLSYFFMKKSFERAQLLFTDTRRDYAILKEHFPDKTFFVKLGIQQKNISPVDQVGHLNKVPQLVSVAMLRPDRKFPSVQWLVETLSEMQKEGQNFHYHHIGGGECFDKLKKLCEELLAEGSFSLHGTLNKEETLSQLKKCDLFVYPGIGESFGMVYLEAQSQGLPVVAFANGGIADAVADNVSGFLVPSFDRESFKNRILELILNNKKYEQFAKKAVEYVSQNHNRDENYKEMLKLIQQKTGLSC